MRTGGGIIRLLDCAISVSCGLIVTRSVQRITLEFFVFFDDSLFSDRSLQRKSSGGSMSLERLLIALIY